MSQITTFNFDTKDLSLYRDVEEDLVDYDDSDVEIETGDNKKSSVAGRTEELQLDTHPDDAMQPDNPAHAPSSQNEEEANKQQDTGVSASNLPATKTPQAAALIKSVQNLLADSAFQASLGLSAADDSVYLSLWANGFNFALTLKLIGTAEVRVCKYGAKCYNAHCTFDHKGADRTAVTITGKPRKLCSAINTPIGCLKGSVCWYSHEAEGMTCAHGDLRATCPKGLYCFYKHTDDVAVTSTELVVQPSMQIEGTEEGEKIATTAQTSSPVKPSPNVEERDVPAPSATDTASPGKQHAAGHKRSRELGSEIEDRSHKTRRVHKRPDGHSARRNSASERLQSDRPRQGRRGSGQARHRRGQDVMGRKGDRYRPLTGKLHAGKDERRKGSLQSRMTRD